jgi:hypothetical protein
LGLLQKPIPEKKKSVNVYVGKPKPHIVKQIKATKEKQDDMSDISDISDMSDDDIKTTTYKPKQALIQQPKISMMTGDEAELLGKTYLDNFKKFKTGLYVPSTIKSEIEKEKAIDDMYDDEDKIKVKEHKIPKMSKIIEKTDEDSDEEVDEDFKTIVNKKDFVDMFPYMKSNVPKDVLKRLLLLDISKTEKENGEIIEVYRNVVSLNRITALFSEKARMKCTRINSPSGLSPFDYYLKHKKTIDEQVIKAKKLNATQRETILKQIRKNIFSQAPDCSYFNVSRVIYLFKYLFGNNVKALRKLKWLDMSAGWGDRLIAAIVLGLTKYVGADPSIEMKNIYPKIINKLVKPENKDKYNVFSQPFEDIPEMKEEFDIAFTSPPFYDFEIYCDDSQQCIQKYPNETSWVNDFLIPYTLKAWRSVRKNGFVVLYIEDKEDPEDDDVSVDGFKAGKGGKYVNAIKQHLGTPAVLKMRYSDQDKDKARSFYIWQKTDDIKDEKMTTMTTMTTEPKHTIKTETKIDTEDTEDTVDTESKSSYKTDDGKPKTKEELIALLREDCKPGQIKNPKTGRCVKEDGPTGKKLIKQMMFEYGIDENKVKPIEEPAKKIDDIVVEDEVEDIDEDVDEDEEPKPVIGQPKTKEEVIALLREDCEPGFIKNPKSGRCVKEDGPTGKKLIGDMLKLYNITKQDKKAVKAVKKQDVIPGIYKQTHKQQKLDISKIMVGDKHLVKPKYEIKLTTAPTYFQNNREKFIEEINKLFKPLKNEIKAQEKEVPTCDKKTKDRNFSLMTHQKVIHDYINNMAPYRGLLIYHGLGSGKTCTSIAVAEGLKEHKKVFIMTPASLRSNYIKELKNCGDELYKTNHVWKFLSRAIYAENLDKIAVNYGIPYEFVKSNNGIWVTISNPKEKTNYHHLSIDQRASLNKQIDQMINKKYNFINYNGIRKTGLDALIAQGRTEGKKNPFDHSVIIVDEAHNLISRIVNKIKQNKTKSLSYTIYDLLMNADDCRIVFLTGTPIINYPNELGVIFNILRGYIKTFEIPLRSKTGRLQKKNIFKTLQQHNLLDYMDYDERNDVLIVTRNPYGFFNKYTKGTYKGVKHTSNKGKIATDDEFITSIVEQLREKDIEAIVKNIKLTKHKLLPDKAEEFINLFIGSRGKDDVELTNQTLLKQRILGFTSYYRSAQESLLPRYDEDTDRHIINIPMSDHQFQKYKIVREKELKQEEKDFYEKAKKQKQGIVDVYDDVTSTYRIFSRLACNFVFPDEVRRPMPNGENIQDINLADLDEDIIDAKPVDEIVKSEEGVLELDDADELASKISKNVNGTYQRRIQEALDMLKMRESEYLTGDGLKIYSPKFSVMLDNIINTLDDPIKNGLHLVYSSFRNIEGIELFRMVLEANGFSQFKLKRNADSEYVLNMTEEELEKPSYMLYTGKETVEEKETMRNVYNGNWSILSTKLQNQLREIAPDNSVGQIIKVIMITASGAEGIDLKNTRYVHIMEPYWHPVRVEQVIGRARRICSHKELPPEMQDVTVYNYLMTFTPEQIAKAANIRMRDGNMTTDQSLDNLSNKKKKISTELLKSIKESSIDCNLHNKSNIKEGLVCYKIQNPKPDKFNYKPIIDTSAKDEVIKMNMQVVKYKYALVTLKTPEHPSGKKYVLKKVINDAGQYQFTNEVYDYESYKFIKENPGMGGEPDYIGELVKIKDGLYNIV